MLSKGLENSKKLEKVAMKDLKGYSPDRAQNNGSCPNIRVYKGARPPLWLVVLKTLL